MATDMCIGEGTALEGLLLGQGEWLSQGRWRVSELGPSRVGPARQEGKKHGPEIHQSPLAVAQVLFKVLPVCWVCEQVSLYMSP